MIVFLIFDKIYGVAFAIASYKELTNAYIIAFNNNGRPSHDANKVMSSYSRLMLNNEWCRATMVVILIPMYLKNLLLCCLPMAHLKYSSYNNYELLISAGSTQSSFTSVSSSEWSDSTDYASIIYGS